MLRYLRAKDFLDLVHDLIVWLLPGKPGQVMAAVAFMVVLAITAAFYSLVYYHKFARWMWGGA
jgi:hypothetical protein